MPCDLFLNNVLTDSMIIQDRGIETLAHGNARVYEVVLSPHGGSFARS